MPRITHSAPLGQQLYSKLKFGPSPPPLPDGSTFFGLTDPGRCPTPWAQTRWRVGHGPTLNWQSKHWTIVEGKREYYTILRTLGLPHFFMGSDFGQTLPAMEALDENGRPYYDAGQKRAMQMQFLKAGKPGGISLPFAIMTSPSAHKYGFLDCRWIRYVIMTSFRRLLTRQR